MAEEFIRRLIITGPETDETVDLAEGTFVIGRQSGNAIRLNNPMISRQHAQIECSAAACQITDLGSANGSSLNGQPLDANTPTPLKAGDKIQAITGATISTRAITYAARDAVELVHKLKSGELPEAGHEKGTPGVSKEEDNAGH